MLFLAMPYILLSPSLQAVPFQCVSSCIESCTSRPRSQLYNRLHCNETIHFHVFLPILQYAHACTAICSMQAQLLSLHNTQTTLLLSQLLGLSHLMILSMQQPCVLDLSLAMLQDVCQYTYFLDKLDLRDTFPRMHYFAQLSILSYIMHGS